MKYVKYWLLGWLEYAIEIITWPIFAPYYKGLYGEKIREALKENDEGEG